MYVAVGGGADEATDFLERVVVSAMLLAGMFTFAILVRHSESQLVGFGTARQKTALNEAQIPNFRGVRVHVSSGYFHVEGNRRASRNGDSPPDQAAGKLSVVPADRCQYRIFSSLQSSPRDS